MHAAHVLTLLAASLSGRALLRDRFRNRGTAFNHLDREANRLVGLLPASIESTDVQLARTKLQFDSMPTPISKYVFLRELEDDSTSLFYKFVAENLLECLPIIYTPTVGEACQRFSELWRKPRGVFITAADKGRIAKVLDNVPLKDVHIVVVTDGGRILGLGDQGANGMGIPIGKIALYCAGGGFNPRHALPVTLDLGTNNEELLADPLYIGARHPRLPDDEYYAIVDEFLSAVQTRWPSCVVQFEDFSTRHSLPLLANYRHSLRCFNDDIQGTGSVILGGLINALKIQGTKPEDARIVFYGAGSAAVGCAQMIVSLLVSLGVPTEKAHKQFWMMDSRGLLTTDREDVETMRQRAPHKLEFLRDDVKAADSTELLNVIKHVQPNVLMGLSGSGESFGKNEVELMFKTCARPIICPLSNPTSKAEISATKAYEWTHGNCIFASGSPFAPVTIGEQTYTPAQGNNMFIFPGVGLGAFLAETSEVSDEMFIEAAKSLADMVTDHELSSGALYPPLNDLLTISARVAARVMEVAVHSGLSDFELPDGETYLSYVVEHMWSPPHHQGKTPVPGQTGFVVPTSVLGGAQAMRMSATADAQGADAASAAVADDAAVAEAEAEGQVEGADAK